jgi:RND family efflux transporter MFP subunit
MKSMTRKHLGWYLTPGRASRAGLALAILALAGLTSCGDSAAKGEQPQGVQAIPVKVQVTRSVPVRETTEYVATLKSRDSAVIMPQVDGQITAIFVHSGDRVAPGTPLMQIDPAKQEATVNNQESTLAAKRAEVEFDKQQYTRASGLFSSGVSSRQELDQAKSALDTATSQLSALEAQVREETVTLRYYRVTAPTTGVVGDIPVRVGDRVSTTTILTTVDKSGKLEAYIYVPIERAAQLKRGLLVQLVDGAGNVLSDTRISFISPQVDNTTQSILAKAVVPDLNGTLRTSQFTRARVIWGTREGTVVPVLAVSRIGGQFFVFVAEDDKGKTVAHQRPLRIGDIVGNDYVVLRGLKTGDKVIVSGTQFLVDGVPVLPQA